MSFFTWEIEGTEYESLKDVIAAVPVYDRVADRTAAMRAAKIDTSKPEAEINFELPDGRILVGTRSPDAPVVEDTTEANGEDDGTDPDEDE